MRLCRFRYQEEIVVGYYGDTHVTPLAAVAAAFARAEGNRISLPEGDNLLTFLPPGGEGFAIARQLAEWLAGSDEAESLRVPVEQVELLLPNPKPPKLFLLAGNYAKHIEEGGGIAAERAETFPYVFMKPPTTTLTDPHKPVSIPTISPDAIDWELELAVVIGRGGRAISEANALDHVAGYTIINDISNRKFRPNPDRTTREKDKFFDWLHGKWFDSFCPCGPCITSADAIPDPQTLDLRLDLNGERQQDSSTASQIFPVAAVIEFISSMTTLEPGDMISTGTPAGVGMGKGLYLKPGDLLEASISSIGTLTSPVVAEESS